MVKRDKVDILDLFLEHGVDIGHFLSEEGQAFTKPRLIEDNTIPVFSQSHVMDDLTPPYGQTDDSQQLRADLPATLYTDADFFNDSVSAVVEVPHEITLQQAIEGVYTSLSLSITLSHTHTHTHTLNKAIQFVCI